MVASGGYIEIMEQVGIKALKNRLSQYVRAAAGGQTVLVTDRGEVVAELVPPRVCLGATLVAQRLGDLARQEMLTPARLPQQAQLPRRVPLATLDDVLRDLHDGRADR